MDSADSSMLLFGGGQWASHRPVGFAWSLLIHTAILSTALLMPQPSQFAQPAVSPHKYSVLVVRLDELRKGLRAPAPSASPGSSHSGHGVLAAIKTLDEPPSGAGSPAGQEGAALSDDAPEAPRNQFVLPPVRSQEHAKQTLVVLDVPPEVQLAHEVPLPTIVMWRPAPIHKTFVAPPQVARPRVQVQIDSAPDLSPPNQEPTLAVLKMADARSFKNTKIFRQPANTAPVRTAAVQVAPEAPQITSSTAPNTSLAALVSLPRIPVLTGDTAAIPPTNQLSAAGTGGNGRSGRTGQTSDASLIASGAGNGLSNGATDLTGINNSGGAGRGSVRSASAQGDETGMGRGGDGSKGALGLSGNGRPRLANSGNGQSGSVQALRETGLGGGSALQGTDIDPSEIDRPAAIIPGTTRVEFPKQGKFDVIVTGSSLAAPYAESAGVLGGKIIYNVYVSVGLRKKWILQYCLLREDERKTATRGSLPAIESPWPYQVIRPDNFSGDNGGYVIVHGVLTSRGRLDQLGLIFPTQIDQQDLLMKSLGQWTFRPARRDGVASDVEVLLIIPSQSE